MLETPAQKPARPIVQPPKSPRSSRATVVVSLCLKWLTAFVVASTAVAVIGTLLPDIPLLGLSTYAVGAASIWFVAVPLIAAATAVVLWRHRRTRYGTAVVVVGILAAAGAGLVTNRMIAAAENAGADISILRASGFGEAWSAAPDEEPVYLTDQGDELRVNVYRPHNEGRGLAPVLLYIHGGGWTLGSRNAHSADMRWFANRGWLVLSIDYSLSSPRRHLWNVTQGQVGCALSWVAENATAYGGDAQRLSLTGDSAGGNLAINTAYLRAAGQLPSVCGGAAPHVDAVSVLYPAVHPAGIYDYSSTGRRLVTNYIGGSPKQLAERYAAVDSIEKINPNAPPTLILTGEADDLVSIDDVDAFAQQARAAGVNIKMVRLPHANHAFDLLPGSIGQQAYRQLTYQWLTTHGQQP